MDENKHLQPEQPASPEEQLDMLLAQFLAEPDLEFPVAEEAPAMEAAIPPTDEIAEADAAEAEPADGTAPDTSPLSEPDVPDAPDSPADEFPSDTPVTLPNTAQEPTPLEDTWIGEIMDIPMITEEICADESAVAAAGLVHPDDQEFVDILQELQLESPPEDPQPRQEEPLPPEIDEAPPEDPLPEEEGIEETKEPEEMAKPTQTEEPEESIPVQDFPRPLRKIRPKRKGAYGFFSLPHLATTVIWLAIIVFIGVSLGNILWEYAADMLAFGRKDSVVTITISETDDLDDICDKLTSTGLIKYPSLFKLYAGLADAMESIKPGTYKLNTLYDYNALVDQMSAYAARVTTQVVIPEGYNCSQIFQLLENSGVSTVQALQNAASQMETSEYWFLEGLNTESENWLEGYLFPDTYTFYLNHDPEGVLDKLLTNFDRRLTESMRSKLPILNENLSQMMRKNGLSEEYIASHQMSMRDIVIIASMIEKEAANTAEGYTIASVIYNRLTNPYGETAGFLQIDATLVYVTGHSVLTAEDLDLDSPYNTYKYAGMIPGPITNPSQASLAAALNPDSTDYYYYALNPAIGEHKFSETLAEHDAFLESLRNEEE